MSSLAFFNNKGGVGKTSLVAHLAWMFAERGVPVLAVDLDPQANLSALFLTDERLQTLWEEEKTLLASVLPLMERTGDIKPVHIEPVAPRLHLISGDLGLSRFEDLLAENWSQCLTGEPGPFRVMSAFHRLMRGAAAQVGALLILIDLGPNLGALNRAALLAADRVILPVAPDLFSLQGMRNLGPTLRKWREGWQKRRGELKAKLDVPEGAMTPIGYVLMSFGVRDNRPVQAYEDWTHQIPKVYREQVLGLADPPASPDPDQLAALKHYRSLMPLAMTARKPMFSLRAADGARGAHLDAVRRCYDDFLKLAFAIAARVGPAGA